MNIGGVEVGGINPCRFVAEISNNHNGSLDRGLRLIDAAKDAGADFVKFQCYTPDELVALRGDGPAPEPWGSDGWTMRTLYSKAQTPLEWFETLFSHAREIGIVPFSSVFGHESLEVLKSLDCPAYKIAKLDNRHSWLIEEAKKTGKPFFVSVDGRAEHNVHSGEINLYCPGSYPCGVEDVNLPDDFERHGYLGLSSHCLHPLLPPSAVAAGAKLIEMHMMLEAEPSELESNVSITEKQFKAMVDGIRRMEASDD